MNVQALLGEKNQKNNTQTWKSSALLLARSALFPARAITILGLACLWSSLTQFFARANDSWGKHTHIQSCCITIHYLHIPECTLHTWQWETLRRTDSLHLWCRTPLWLPALLCNTSAPNCGSAPDRLCPRSQTSPSCHPNILSESGRPLEGKRKKKQNKQTNIKKTGGVRFLWLLSQVHEHLEATHSILCFLINIYLMVLDFTYSITDT